MSGQTIGGVLGAAIGFWVGGPTGAQYGWMIGSVVGGVVDPDVIKGPKLQDRTAQTSAEGVPRPLVYGLSGWLQGNVIQVQNIATEHKHEDSTGKGGPVQETYTYTRTVAIRICRAAPLGGEMMLRRARVGGKLAYDATGSGAIDADSAKFFANMRFYSGSESQMPDPALEALPASDGGGVGNVPAYRGSCYIVFPDLECPNGALPQFEFEVASVATAEPSILNPPWIASDGQGNFQTSNGTDWTTNPKFSASANGRYMRYANGTLLMYGVSNTCVYSTDKALTWANTTLPAGLHPNQNSPATVFGNAFWLLSGGGSVLHGNGSTLVETALTYPHQAPISIACTGSFQVLGCQLDGSNNSYVEKSTDFFVTHAQVGVGLGEDATLSVSNGSRVLVCAGNGGYAKYTDDGATYSSAITLPGGVGSALRGGAANGSVWVVVGNNGIAVSTNNAASFTLATLDEEFHPYDVGIGGGLIVVVGERNAGAGTSRIYTASVSDPFTWTKRSSNFGFNAVKTVAFMTCDGYAIPDAPGWYVHRDGTLCGQDANIVTPGTVGLDSIVGDLIQRTGVTDYDVSALSAIDVTGYPILQPTDAAGAIKVLQQVYFFDLAEWGNSTDDYPKLRAVLRGGASVLNLSDDDLVDVDDDKDTRAQSIEFPVKLNFIAPDPTNNYETIKQTASRESENAKAASEITVTTPVLFTRDESAQRADIMLRIAWEEAAGRLTRTLPEAFTAYVTSDIVTYGERRYRIDRITADDGISRWEMTRDRATAYVSNATGSSGIVVPATPSGTIGPTLLQALNLTSLRSSDNVPGMYIFVCGLLPAWSGCDLYLSVDGGITESKVATIITPSKMGWLTADMATGDVTLSVNLYNDDELDSVTPDQLAARMNACAVTSGGVSEILQFQTATDTGVRTYDLTDLTRAELGTIEAAHVIDDDFVLLDGSETFLKLDTSLAGKALRFRPVSRGTTPAQNEMIYTVTFDPPTFVIDGGEVTP